MTYKPVRVLFLIIFSVCSFTSFSQFRAKEINWTADGSSTLIIKEGNIVKTDLKTSNETVLVKRDQLIPAGATVPLAFNIYSFSPDYKTLLIFTNTAKVWRYHTRGDYWILNLISNQLTQLGKTLPSQSLMFAKISPDGKEAAYVSEHNLYLEDLSTHAINALSSSV
jgi:dipeptidyl-peptidase-4